MPSQLVSIESDELIQEMRQQNGKTACSPNMSQLASRLPIKLRLCLPYPLSRYDLEHVIRQRTL